MGKHITRSLCFLLPLLLAAVLLGLLFRPKNNTASGGMLETDPLAVSSQPENSLDVLFLGDSEAYSSFVPLDLWEQTGITSFVCSSLDQKTYETLELLNMALGCQSPQVVVLETNVLYRVYASTDALSPKLEARIPALRYHDRWKSLSLWDFCSMPRYTAPSPDRGYHLLTKAKAADVEGYMAPMEEREPLSRTNLADLKKITEVCRKQGISLVLFSAPSPANWTMRRHNTIQDTAESLGLPYIDGNLLDLGIDWDTDTYDRGDHLNYSGAAKVTAWLGDYLRREVPGLTDRRGDPDHSAWDRDAAAFRARLEAQE